MAHADLDLLCETLWQDASRASHVAPTEAEPYEAPIRVRTQTPPDSAENTDPQRLS